MQDKILSPSSNKSPDLSFVKPNYIMRPIFRWLLLLAVVALFTLLASFADVSAARRSLRSIAKPFGILLFLLLRVVRRLVPPLNYVFPIGTVELMYCADKWRSAYIGALVYQLMKLSDVFLFLAVRWLYSGPVARLLGSCPRTGGAGSGSSSPTGKGSLAQLGARDEEAEAGASASNRKNPSPELVVSVSPVEVPADDSQHENKMADGAEEPWRPQQSDEEPTRCSSLSTTRSSSSTEEVLVAQTTRTSAENHVADKTLLLERLLPDSLASALLTLDRAWLHTISAASELKRVLIIAAWMTAAYMDDQLTLYFFATRTSPATVCWGVFCSGLVLALCCEYLKSVWKARLYVAVADGVAGDDAGAGGGDEDSFVHSLIGAFGVKEDEPAGEGGSLAFRWAQLVFLVVVVGAATVYFHGSNLRVLVARMVAWWRARNNSGSDVVQRKKTESWEGRLTTVCSATASRV